jgi:hypothetical protein
VNDFDFMFYLADIFTLSVQYGSRSEMCNNYLDVSNSSDPSTIDLSKIYNLAQAKNVHYSDYNSYELAKTTVSNMTVGRQWTYQYCTMFGWF